MVCQLPPWFENLKKRQVRSPKVYIRDSGLLHAGHRLGFEFKFSDRPATTRSMRIALADLALDHLYIVHPGEHEFPLDESITAITLPRLIDVLRSEVARA